MLPVGSPDRGGKCEKHGVTTRGDDAEDVVSAVLGGVEGNQVGLGEAKGAGGRGGAPALGVEEHVRDDLQLGGGCDGRLVEGDGLVGEDGKPPAPGAHGPNPNPADGLDGSPGADGRVREGDGVGDVAIVGVDGSDNGTAPGDQAVDGGGGGECKLVVLSLAKDLEPKGRFGGEGREHGSLELDLGDDLFRFGRLVDGEGVWADGTVPLDPLGG